MLILSWVGYISSTCIREHVSNRLAVFCRCLWAPLGDHRWGERPLLRRQGIVSPTLVMNNLRSSRGNECVATAP